jgi:hypothetical protein
MTYHKRVLFMKNSLPFFRLLLPLLVLALAGAVEANSGDPASGQNIRIFYSGNVLAELEPCG